MNIKLQKTFDLIETERQRILSEVSTLKEDALNKTPGPGKWSILQILTHLLIAERLSVLYMRKKSKGVDQLDNAGVLESFKLGVLKISQRLPIRYKAPKVVREHTPEALPLQELITQWNTLRGELNLFLNSIEEKNVRKKIYKHPIAGRLDVNQAMLFFREHVNHHQPQIKRLIPLL